MTYFTDEQISLLLKPIHPNRVLMLKGMAYVEGHDIRAELNRVFGFGRWSEEIIRQELVCETETKTNAGKAAWNVVYRSQVRLTIHAPDGSLVTYYDGAHVGENTHPVRGEAHAIALTASQTYALRRCAINLGDQFGLSLYNKGSLDPIVRWTLVRPEKDTPDTDDIPVIASEDTESGEVITKVVPVEEPKVTRTRSKPAEKPAPELTLQETINTIANAKTVDELKIAWRGAANAGRLSEDIILPATGEKITVKGYLHKKHDELAPAKSNDTGTGDAEGNPGTPAGGK